MSSPNDPAWKAAFSRHAAGVREELTHTTDGPVTRFVLIARAVHLVARRPESAVHVAEVLAEELHLTDEQWDETLASSGEF